MKNIVIVNAHWSNRGDEAALRAIIDRILELVKDVKITIIFKEKGEILQFPYASDIEFVKLRFLPTYFQVRRAVFTKGKWMKDQDMKKTADIVENADFVIYAPGGAVISDRFWWKKQLEYLFPLAYAEKWKIPVFIAAPSIGPFHQKRRFRKKVLERVDRICVREELSEQELKKEVSGENVVVTIDSAFLDMPDEAVNQKKYSDDASLVRFFECYDKVVGVTVTDLGWHVEYGRQEEIKKQIAQTFQDFIRYLGKKKIGVILIPQLFGSQNDKEYLKGFAGENTCLLSDGYDTYFQQYIISKLYALVGMRYHSNIFAAKMGVPFIPVIYEEKMRGFADIAGMHEWSVELNDLSAEVLERKFARLEENIESIRKRLLQEKQGWKDKAELTAKELELFLKQ